MDHQRIVNAYIKIRDKRSEIKKAFDAEDTALKAKLTLLEGAMLQTLNSTNSDSIRTDGGTFYSRKM